MTFRRARTPLLVWTVTTAAGRRPELDLGETTHTFITVASQVSLGTVAEQGF